MRTERMLRAGVLLACTMVAGCLTPMDPTRVPVASVQVTVGDQGRSVDTVQVRSTARVHAIAIAREGYDVGLTSFRYASSDAQVAVVDTLGILRGVSPGTAVITATTPSGVSGSAKVVVTPSTIAYTIPVGSNPGAIVFSPDYTKAYVAVGGDSIAFVDALGFFRASTIGLGARIGTLAATASTIYATHPDVDSVSVVSASTKDLLARLWVGAGPDGVAAHGTRAYVAARYDHRIAVIENGAVTAGLPVNGEPHALALSGDGTRLFATVLQNGSWRLLSIDPFGVDTLASLPLDAEPADLAASNDGTRVLVLEPTAGRLLDVTVSSGGGLSLARTVSVSSGAGGVAMKSYGVPYVIVSGNPLEILDGATLATQEQIPGTGAGYVAVRPDGLFVFVGDRSNGTIQVIGL